MKAARISYEGVFYACHSLAHVNRELVKALLDLGVKGLSVSPLDGASAEKSLADPRIIKLAGKRPLKQGVHIRHSFPPITSPADRLIVMQPWEFIEAPASWVDFFASNVAELWVNSHFTRQCYVNSGVPSELVKLLPLGFDPVVFFPSEPPPGTFRFLYTGGTIERKGIDLALDAYLSEFSKDEPVELVVKDVGTRHVYQHNNLGDRIGSMASSQDGTKVVYIDSELSQAEMGDLYRSCHCLVQPYRAEGFCLPVLEAMACGLPVIVTQGGPTDDYVPYDAGWKVSSRRVQIPQLAGLETRGSQGWLEPELADLRRAMREAFDDRDGAAKRGQNALAAVSDRYTWKSVAPLYLNRILAVQERSAAKEKRTSTVSLCMIGKNEARVVAECLQSARPFMDEIIFVDTGSTDDTKTIAAKYADKVVDFEWCDSFSAARNESLRHATGDWVFWLDCDDTLPTETGEEIRKAIRNAPPSITAYVVPVRFVEDGPAGGTQVDHVKLFRNVNGVKFEGRIHEQVLPSLRAHGGDLARLNGVVLHTNYDSSPEGQERKRKRDLALLRLDHKERPNHPFVFFNFGMSCHYWGEHRKAISWLKRSIKAASEGESHIRKAYALMLSSYRRLNLVDKAFEVAAEGLEKFPKDPELLFHFAMLCTEQRRFHDAITAYNQALGAENANYFSSLDVGILGFKSHHNLASLHAQVRDYGSARKHYLEAMRLSPDRHQSALDLFDNACQVGDKQTAEAAIEFVGNNRLGKDIWTALVVRYLDQFASQHAADSFLEGECKPEAENDKARLMLGTRLLERGENDRGRAVLGGLAQAGSAEANFMIGVSYTRAGDLSTALNWMEKAQALNPSHEPTNEQVKNLRMAMRPAGPQ